MAGPQRHTLLRGGARSGKTFLFVRGIVIRALRAFSRHAILRFRFNAVRSSVWLDTFPKVMRDCFGGVPFQEARQDGFVVFPSTKSEVWFGGLDEKERVEKILGMEFCIAPEVKVLAADLRWIKASDIVVGQELIAFPENLDGHQKLERSVVTQANTITAPRYRVTTTRGTIVVSEDHRFVSLFDDRRTRNWRYLSWKHASGLKVGDHLRFACKPWQVEDSYESRWLAGILDGEGWLSGGQLGVAQNPGIVLDRIGSLLASMQISFRNHANAKCQCRTLMPASLWGSMKLLGMIRPVRLMEKAADLWEGRRGFATHGQASGYGTGRRANERGHHVATVLSIEKLPPGPVVAIGTSTRTMITDGFLSHNCTIFFNECSQIPFSSVEVALTRLAQKTELKNRACYDLNPVNTAHWTHRMFIEKKTADGREKLVDPDNYATMRINPEDNAANLDPGFLRYLDGLSSRQRKRFRDGEYSSEVEGQLWTLESFSRIEPANVPHLRRIVVAIDPSGCEGAEDYRSDEIGIVVAGRGVDDQLYILADRSGRYSPEKWGRIAVDSYREFHADRIVGEKNFGGAMVESVIRNVDRNVPFLAVTASRGKAVRADPVSVIYEQHKAHHAGTFAELEDQLCNFSTSGYLGDRSPDHADALVWAATDLFELTDGFFGYAESLARGAREKKANRAVVPVPKVGDCIGCPEGKNGKHFLACGLHPSKQESAA